MVDRASIPALTAPDAVFLYTFRAIARVWNSGEGDSAKLLQIVELFEAEAEVRGISLDSVYSKL